MDAIREWLATQWSNAGGVLETVFGRLAYPAALWLLAVQPLLWLLAIRAWFRRRRDLPRAGAGLVAFAAGAKVVCPLTHDYDHFRDAVRRLDAADLPPELRPASADDPSGTRIGAGLHAALAAHDPDAAGYQDLLLVSDGDDPA